MDADVNTGREARGAIASWAVVAQAIICLSFGAFIVGRAARLSLTYDEAAAYIRYVAPHAFPEFDNGPLAVFNFEVATNHFLSTVLTKLVATVAGGGELALRAPALLGYALYLWFSVRLLRLSMNGVIAAAGLLLLNLNPYLLDFFALSRGYGLSIGLMMGALYYLFMGDLSRMLLFATGAVLANFAMLNVYAGLLLLSVGSGRSGIALRRRTSLALLFPSATLFAALVFSQDPGLSSSLYEPVAVRLDGLTAEQQRDVTISRIDLRGRMTPLSAARVPCRAIRIETPAEVSDRLAHVEVVIGHRAFTSDPHVPDAWTMRDLGTRRQFESAGMLSNPRSSQREFEGVINWAGDRQYFLAIARATAVALAVLVALALVLEAAGRLAVRARLVPDDAWHLLPASILWVAALAGPPLYLLKRDAQLYFGGTRGLVHDTFYSLIEDSFYGITYHPNQTPVAFGIAVAFVAAFALFASATWRRDRLRAPLEPARILALIAIVSVSLVAQRWLLGTVYLIGRTALLFIPLYFLFLIFFCQSLIARGGIARIAGTSMLLVAVMMSGWHFARTANLQYTLDWRDDAATKTMMADLEQAIAVERSGAPTTLGVQWNYAPAAAYYAHRHQPVDIDVVVLPSGRSVDFVYLAERHASPSARIIRRYPVSATALVRP